MQKVTVFTPTYNRAYIIGKLYDSLKKQTSFAFDWLVIDDGSTDETERLFADIQRAENPFSIKYIKIENGGKQRAINYAVNIMETEFVFIVDSDDYLTEDALTKVNSWIDDLPEDRKQIAGVSGVRGKKDGTPIGGEVKFPGEYIEATNMERSKYNLLADMAEIYRVDVLKKFPFRVWQGEKFVPEAVVWDELALSGYKLRWYKDVIYICEYLEDGLTKGSWNLLKKNPMGYAMLFNQKLKYLKGLKRRSSIVCQMLSCIYIAGEKSYLQESNAPVLSFLLRPIGKILMKRRQKQFAMK